MMSCGVGCWALVECTTCGLTKPPRGRDVASAMANGMCGRDCPGYGDPPVPGHLWPSEAVTDDEDESTDGPTKPETGGTR